jgi:hypothetical protein
LISGQVDSPADQRIHQWTSGFTSGLISGQVDSLVVQWIHQWTSGFTSRFTSGFTSGRADSQADKRIHNLVRVDHDPGLFATPHQGVANQGRALPVQYNTTSPSTCPPPKWRHRPVIGDCSNTSGTPGF